MRVQSGSARITRVRTTAMAFAITSLLAAAPLALAAGKPWVVQAPATSDGLVIKEGALPVAAAGKQLTMTVDGMTTPIAPGSYRGKVVLTPTDDVVVTYKQLDPHQFRSAIYVNDGRYVAGKSVAAAVQGGSVDDQGARGVRIDSNEARFNGVVVTGDSKYTLDAPVIDLVGNGGNDFAGYGAAIMSSGNAEVTVNRPKIRTHGAIRTAIFVGGKSTMHVNDADIEVYNGTLPADYKFTIEVGKMMEVPWMLGLHGNVRATNLVDHGTVYYTRAHIKAQGWGALSTDDAAVTRMYVKDSLIEVIDSGYGAYSIGDSIDSFSNSTLNVADVGLIMAGQGSGVFTDGSVVNSGRYGVMMHAGNGAGTLTVDKGSVINSRSTAIEAKGRGGQVILDHAQVNAGNGIVLQAMENDDPFMKKMMAGGPPPGPIVGEQGPEGATPEPPPHPDVDVLANGMKLTGDFINTRTKQGGLNLELRDSSLVGAVSTGTQAALGGQEPTDKTYWQIGHVINTFAPTPEANGATVKVGEGSRWVVTKTSYLTGLDLAKGSEVVAAPGYKLSLSVDGKVQALKPGHYQGKLVVDVQALN
ncbi:hypothetical protein [Pseudoxanthomonas sp.]|uniref:hypothetical protein n=1 Tax=Pseudoxanthomonas sp. TaxID=1871049 RepID=UPI002608E51C|nr:hypothetical protein [Pseudoxanthomonas sp.]WDS35040.1 MAG: hypothetical protein O8I58_11720 [Pseudoxanthomonas sp.]